MGIGHGMGVRGTGEERGHGGVCMCVCVEGGLVIHVNLAIGITMPE